MRPDVQRLPTSVNDAAEMLQPWLGEAGLLTDIYAQVEHLDGITQKQERDAKRLFKAALEQVRGK